MGMIDTLYQVGSVSEACGYGPDDHGDWRGNVLTIEVFDLHVRPKSAIMPCTAQAVKGELQTEHWQPGMTSSDSHSATHLVV